MSNDMRGQTLGGSRVLEAVIHYPLNCIPGLDKSSYRHHHLDASTETDLSKFLNKMPSPDNPGTAVAPFPHVLRFYKSERGWGRHEREDSVGGRERERQGKRLRRAGGEWESVNINTEWK